LESIYNNLQAQPHHFCKHVSSLHKHRSYATQLLVDGEHINEPSAVAGAFAKHFQSVLNTQCPVEPHPFLQSSEFLPLVLVSDEDVRKAIKRLKPYLSAGLDNTLVLS
jgi:hypothetical protein